MNRLLCLRIQLPKIFIFSAETEEDTHGHWLTPKNFIGATNKRNYLAEVAQQ